MMAKRRQTLLYERCINRGIATIPVTEHVRAEFNRLARVIGRLKCGFPYNKYEHAIQDVERLLKEAKR